MIKGMTGFGTADFAYNNVEGVVEIKTVNHRYLDIGFYLPSGCDGVEIKLKEVIAKEIKRGRVNVSFKILTRPKKDVKFNKETLRDYLRQAKLLKKELQIGGDLTIADLIHLPGVVETTEQTMSIKRICGGLEGAVKKALQGVMMMRKREGKALAKDIGEQIKRILFICNEIQKREKQIKKVKRKKFTTEEFSAFQKSIDVNEEIKRLQHHAKEIRQLLRATSPAGKRIDFIAQEMQRETNTIGSKLQDKIVSHKVILLKSKIEKIREQTQNVE